MLVAGGASDPPAWGGALTFSTEPFLRLGRAGATVP